MVTFKANDNGTIVELKTKGALGEEPVKSKLEALYTAKVEAGIHYAAALALTLEELSYDPEVGSIVLAEMQKANDEMLEAIKEGGEGHKKMAEMLLGRYLEEVFAKVMTDLTTNYESLDTFQERCRYIIGCGFVAGVCKALQTAKQVMGEEWKEDVQG